MEKYIVTKVLGKHLKVGDTIMFRGNEEKLTQQRKNHFNHPKHQDGIFLVISQFDFSNSCDCKNSTGETWCCNICGLPTNKHTK